MSRRRFDSKGPDVRRRTKQAAIVTGVGLALIGGGSAALATAAAGNSGAKSTATATTATPGLGVDAFLQSVASHLGISVDALRSAIKAAATDQVDAALAAGKITQAQADALKQRIESGKGPLGLGIGPGLGLGLGVGLGPGHAPFAHAGGQLDAAAKAIGIDASTLLDELRNGKSIADVAKEHNVPVDKVEQAMLDSAKTKLDEAVKDGHLTAAQEAKLLDVLKQGIDAFVNGTLKLRSFGFQHPGNEPGYFRFQVPGLGFGFRHPNGPNA
jgi:hypothetical protein